MADIGYTWERVAAAIEADIASGALPAGSMLRGERAMAEQHGVSVSTVRRAVRDLRGRGLLVTLPHKGTFVAEGTQRAHRNPREPPATHGKDTEKWQAGR